MKWRETSIPGVLIRSIEKHFDNRGTFFEEFRLNDVVHDFDFVQDSVSISKALVLRGMHCQLNQWQLVTVLDGSAVDIICDIRNLSENIVKIEKFMLGEEIDQLLLPPGVAHGFCSLADNLVMSYKSSEYYNKANEMNFHWESFNLSDFWPKEKFVVSDKDKKSPRLSIN